ncbi:hypothetical protein Hanom_Chr05g00415641 [Helianthus anomalus]
MKTHKWVGHRTHFLRWTLRRSHHHHHTPHMGYDNPISSYAGATAYNPFEQPAYPDYSYYNAPDVDPYLVAANYNALHPEGPFQASIQLGTRPMGINTHHPLNLYSYNSRHRSNQRSSRKSFRGWTRWNERYKRSLEAAVVYLRVWQT